MYKAILPWLAAMVVARSSPNVDVVERFYRIHGQFHGYTKDVFEEARLDVPDLITKYGYPVEIHKVTTADGYILEMHRIPHGRYKHNDPNITRPPVYLLHGMITSSADFLMLGPSRALGYQLAEAGFDVWLGNSRGNFYSRYHTILDPNTDRDFWKFSWDDIGYYDAPACIDHILKTTGQPRTHFIGFSQGGTSFLVFASLRPEYNKKIISFQGFGTSSFFTHNNMRIMKTYDLFADILEASIWLLYIGEAYAEKLRKITEIVCIEGTALEMFCDGSAASYFMNKYQNRTLLPVIIGHNPCSTSVRQSGHYIQVMRSKSFRRYDHGGATNMLAYGQRTPPSYNLSRITVPCHFYYGKGDVFVHPKDHQHMTSSLPNVASVTRVARNSFNHFDFIWAVDAMELVYNNVIKSMTEYITCLD